MTERQLEMLNNDFRYLAGIVHSQTTDKTLLATKFRVSWPTMQRKVTNLLEAGIIVDKGDSYKSIQIFWTHHYLLAFILMELALTALH